MTAHVIRPLRVNKELATVCAEAARRGATLTPIEGDDGEPELVLTWLNWTRRFRQVSDVSRFLLTLPWPAPKR